MDKQCWNCKYEYNGMFNEPCYDCTDYYCWESKGQNEGKKYDNGKPRWDLVPLNIIEECAKVLTFGANKYGGNNWQNLDSFKSRYLAALLRHLTAWQKGEKVDSESGLPHLSHALTNVVFLLWKELKDNDEGNSN